MRVITTAILSSLFALLLCSCVSLPLHNAGIDDPALQEIASAYEKTVSAALNDPDKEWQSGWLGNMWIHYDSKQQLGLCYEWKYLVHAGVADTVNSVGWQTRGIAINEGTPHEHHAVLVFDPARVNLGKLLTASAQQPVYVLDAWRQGRADIYILAEWLNSPFETRTPPRIFTISEKK